MAGDLVVNCIDFLTEKATDDECKLEGDVLFSENISDSGRRSKTEIDTFMRTEIYFPPIDTTLAKLNRRFSTDSSAVFISEQLFP